jgi:hypothetical protein
MWRERNEWQPGDEERKKREVNKNEQKSLRVVYVFPLGGSSNSKKTNLLLEFFIRSQITFFSCSVTAILSAVSPFASFTHTHTHSLIFLPAGYLFSINGWIFNTLLLIHRPFSFQLMKIISSHAAEIYMQ